MTTIQKELLESYNTYSDKIAIKHKGITLTYSELYEAAFRIAKRIQGENLELESIALIYENKLHLVLGVLGVIFSRNAFVPIPCNTPKDRIKTIISLSDSKLILTDHKLDFDTSIKCIDTVQTLSTTHKTDFRPIEGNEDDVSHIYFTSGSTGVPKGIIGRNASLISFMLWMKAKFKLSPSDNVMQLSGEGFSLFKRELLATFISGATLCIPSESDKSSFAGIANFIAQNDISIINIVPSFYNYLLNNLSHETHPSLRILFIAGEILYKSLLKRHYSVFSPKICQVVNLYGPTETTQAKFFNEIGYDTLDNLPEIIPVGLPINNTTHALIRDENNQIINDPFTYGEVLISTSDYSYGYCDKTQNSSFIIINDCKVFCTGDIGFKDDQERLNIIGRRDAQIKVRGMRVELTEIEAQITKIDAINEAAVVYRKKNSFDEDGQLYAFIVGNADKDFISAKLSKILPEYMIPTYYINIEKLPKNTNNKIDRKLLTEMQLESYTAKVKKQDDAEGETKEIATKLKKLWSKIFKCTVSIYDDFFELGGSSLLVMSIAPQIQKLFDIRINLKVFFEKRTINELASYIHGLEKASDNQLFTIIKAVDSSNYSQLTHVQQAYILGRYGNYALGKIAAQRYAEYKFNFNLNIGQLELSINTLIKRHEMLRTTFIVDDMIQVKHDKYNIKLDLTNYSHLSHEQYKQQLLKTREQMLQMQFDITKLPLFLIRVSRYNNEDIIHFLSDILVIDAHSLNIFKDELTILYQGHTLKPLRYNFFDYISSRENWKKQNPNKYFNDFYWKNRFKSYPNLTPLSILVSPELIDQPIFKRDTKTVKKDIWSKFKHMAYKYNVSPTAALLSIYYHILRKYSSNPNFYINLSIFDQSDSANGYDNIIGDFTDILIFAPHSSKYSNFLELVTKNHELLWNDLEHRDLDGLEVLSIIRHKFDLEPQSIVAPIVFTSLLDHNSSQNFFLDKSYIGEEFYLSQTAQVWLDNNAEEKNGAFISGWDYVSQLFSPEFISNIHKIYIDLIKFFAVNEWILDIPDILTAKDLALIESANSFVQPTNDFISVEDRALIQPDSIAIIDSQGETTYGELIQKNYNISYFLQKLGIKQGELVAILCPKGYQQVVAALAIMKIGAAYLPLHVDWPDGRCDTILWEGNVDYVLISRKEMLKRKNSGLSEKYKFLVIEDIEDSTPSEIKILPHPDLDAMSYVIFTSGSTGKPKGVIISHFGAMNTIAAVNKQFNIGKKDKVLAVSELSFDLSVYDIFGILSAGGTVIFPTQELAKDPEHWYELVCKYKISVWNTVPQIMQILVDHLANSNRRLDSIKTILLSGDKIPLDLPDKIKNKCSRAKIISLGGATEGSIWSIWHEINTVDHTLNTIPYGVAMPNQKMYVLNDFGEHCPVEVIGEIYIGGIGVALGYWGDLEKTNQHFIKHPILGRIYKTGDLGKWNNGGFIEFCGRIDNQVKINGYRIELGEIESKLQNIPGIESVVVTTIPNGKNSTLVAYLVPFIKSSIINKKIDLEFFNREAFKLEAHGILNTKIPDYLLNINLDKSKYLLHKSYRNYSEEVPDTYIINSELEKAINWLEKSIIPKNPKAAIIKNTNDYSWLNQILAQVSCYELDNKILPKYLYPSAGSSYSVRTYLNLASDIIIDNILIKASSYYYNPLSRALQSSMLGKHTATNGIFSFELIAYFPAIKPLYGKSSNKFVYIEAGHILALFMQKAEELNIDFNIEFCDEELDNNNKLLAKVNFYLNQANNEANSVDQKVDFNLGFHISEYLRQGNKFIYKDKEIDLLKLDIFDQVNWYSGRILETSKHIITLDGADTPQNLLCSGILFQRLSNSLHQYNYGSCMLGYEIYPDILYAMSIGIINNAQKFTAEDNVEDKPLKSYINNYLNHQLPEYMIPAEYIVLESIPLSVNGKVDFKALPLPLVKQVSNFVAPRSALEKHLCAIWQKLLGIVNISIYDDFFSIGGDSILSIQLSSSLRNSGYNCSVRDIFELRTILELAKYLSAKIETVSSEKKQDNDFNPSVKISKLLLDKLQDDAKTINNEIEYIFNANSLQQGFIFHALNYPEDIAYRSQLLFEYKQTLNIANYLQAWNFVIQTYPILRTGFNWDEDIIQICYKHGKLNYHIYDLSLEMADVQEQKIEQIRENDLHLAYELHDHNLLKLKIIKLNKEHFVVLRSDHHSRSDGWSSSILINKVHEYYLLLQKNKPVVVKPDMAYINSQVYYTNHQHELSDFWQSRIDHIKSINNLNPLFDKAVSLDLVKSVNQHGEAHLTIKDSTFKKIKNIAKEYGITLNTFFQFAWHKLIQTYTGDEQTIVGITISGRDIPIDGIENSIGLYINTLPLIINWDNDLLTCELLKEIQNEIVEINSHGFMPLTKLQKEGQPIFYSISVFENYPLPDGNYTISDDDNLVANIRFNAEDIHYPLGCIFEEQNNELHITLRYNEEILFEENAYKHLMRLEKILKQLPDLLLLPHYKISVVTDQEFRQIIYQLNQTYLPYPKEKTIQSLFEEQADKIPDNIAIVYGDIQLTYKELNERANSLAHYLRETYQIKGDDLITLCLGRSEHMLIAILGVLKSGGAYVPIDPGYPKDRINYILEDTKAKVLITDQVSGDNITLSFLATTRDTCPKLVTIDNIEFIQQLKKYPKTNPLLNITSSNLAYVIYTSGTTGIPKGVMIEHKSVINLILNFVRIHDLGSNQKISIYSNYVFDAFVYEFIPAITNGNSIYLTSELVRTSLVDFYEFLKINLIDILFVPSILLKDLLQEFKNSASRQDAYAYYPKVIYTGGDKFPDLTRQHYKQDIVLLNEYGPTESTVCATVREYKCGKSPNNIGKPISNITAYVLNSRLTPLPLGAIGELYIGGDGLARGYLNHPELTKERFLANPFQTETDKISGMNDRIYKTGDLVRMLSDGDIEYIGRNDFQVKIRGFRIELGEVEAQLSRFPEIKQAVVLALQHLDMDGNPTGNKYLVGYYVAEYKLDEIAILNYLNKELPDYMVPAILVYLDKLPLTVNGKLDKKALPNPDFRGEREEFIEPRNELDKTLINIFAEVLGVDVAKLSMNADFFKLGGDSILSIQLASRIRQKLGYTLEISSIFKYRRINYIIDKIIRPQLLINEKASILHENGELTGYVGLLPIQKWFFRKIKDGIFKKPWHWNQSFMLKVPIEPNYRLLELSFYKLIAYHDGFRLNYKPVKNDDIVYSQYYAKLTDLQSYKINYLDLTNKYISPKVFNKQLTNWQSRFDPKNNYLFQIGVIRGFEDNSIRIYFALHHLIIDSVSWRIICHDLENIYSKLHDLASSGYTDKQLFELATEEILGVKGTSYRQWVEIVEKYAANQTNKDNSNETKYWQTQLPDKSYLDLWKKYHTQDRTYAHFELSNNLTYNLLTKSNNVFLTEINDILLTALKRTLSIKFNNKVNYITLEGHGREEAITSQNIDINRTVGWFTTMYPFKLESNNDIATDIITTKESRKLVPNHGIGYGALYGYSNIDMPKITFNYLGQLAGKDHKDDTWNLINGFSGIQINHTNEDENLINVFGYVIHGQLNFGINTKLGQQETQLICQIYQQELINIINYTKDQTRTYLTVSDVDYIISSQYLDNIQCDKEIEAVYLANSLQQGFIYHYINQGNVDDAYLVQLIFEYHNELDVAKLKQSWNLALQKYPSLRLRFAWDNELVQIIDKKAKIDFRYLDLSLSKENNKDNQARNIEELIAKDRSEHFDLAKGNLIRVTLIKQSKNLYTCNVNVHHAVLDGWSSPNLLSFVHNCYITLIQTNKDQYVEVDTSYTEAQRYLQQRFLQDWQKDEDYFKSVLAEVDSYIDLSLLQINPNVHLENIKLLVNAKEEDLLITGSLYNKLTRFSKLHAVSMNSILQFAWHKLLSIYGNSNTTIVGAIISGRNLPVDDIEHSVGLYINTLPLVVKHTNLTILEQLQQIQLSINEINERNNVNLAKLHASSNTGKRLFDSLFVYENYPIPKFGKEQKLLIKFIDMVEKLDYPLVVVANEKDKQLIFKLKYDQAIFEHKTIQMLLDKVKLILEQVIEVDYIPKSYIGLLTAKEYDKLVTKYNNTQKPYPKEKTIQALFEEQVAKTPNNTAIVYENVQLTYKELNERANNLAHYLRKNHGVKGDDLIALCLNRSEYMLIAILGILKAGGAYVPIDPDYPEDRISYILEDTKAKALITDKKSAPGLTGKMYPRNKSEDDIPEILVIDNNEFEQKLEKHSKSNPKSNITSSNLAYVIYTSGTTGKPKGVMVEHRNIVSLVKEIDYIDVGETDNIAQFADFAFDAATFEIYISLLNSSSLFIPKNKLELFSNTTLFSNYLNKNQITILWLTKTLFDQLYLQDNAIFSELKYLLVGGEALNTELVKQLVCSSNKPHNFINGYGPTENTTFSCTYQVTPETFDKNNTIPIGMPFSNRFAYILDSNLTPLPIGVIGELYVGGAGIARGYLNLPNLTKERFLANPFQTEAEKLSGTNTRMYKTGDLVRMLADGNIEYIGRNDFQVKIRGYRIELGEIEAQLSVFPGVKQAVILALEHLDADGNKTRNKYLAGYYVAAHKLDETAIFNHLNKELPDYMVPAILIYLDKLPLTVNGKLDRKALPNPAFTGAVEEYIAPRNELDRTLVNIFAEVLGVDATKLSINADFFKLGGDSILSIQLVTKARNQNINFRVADIFEYRTVSKLGELTKLDSSEAVLAHKTGKFRPTPIQRWYFANNKITKNSYFNQSFILNLGKIDVDILTKSIYELVNQHSTFAVFFEKIDNDWVGNYNQDIPVYLDYFDLSHTNNPNEQLINECNRLQKTINILNNKLFNFAVFKLANGYKLFIVLHHLIIDTISWRIIRSDLLSIYKALQSGNTFDSKLEINSFMQWSEALTRYASDKYTLNKVAYWKNMPSCNLKLLKSNKTSSMVKLSNVVSNCLLKILPSTLDIKSESVLLYGLISAFKKLNISNRAIINLERHGRHIEYNSVNITNTIGWFTTITPIYFDLKYDNSILFDALKKIDVDLNRCPDYGLPYAACRYMSQDADLSSELAHKYGEIAFNYIGDLDNAGDNEWPFELMEEILKESGSVAQKEQLIINAMILKSEFIMELSGTSTYTGELALTLEKIYNELYNAYSSNKLTPPKIETFDNGFVPIEILNKFSFKSTLVMVHPGSSGSESYINNICSKLGSDYQLLLLDHYIFRSGKVNASNAHKFSIELFAEKYIKFIKQQQPVGPYNIFGWSFGGVLAIEIMHQLQKQGDTVANLFLLDPALNYKEIIHEMGDNTLTEYFSEYLIKYHVNEINNKNTNLYLFKAMKLVPDDIGTQQYRRVLNYITKKYPANNFKNYVLNEQNLHVINLQCHHDNILETKPITQIAKLIHKILG